MDSLPFQKAFDAGKLPTYWPARGGPVEIKLMNDKHLFHAWDRLLKQRLAGVLHDERTELLYQALQRERVRRRNINLKASEGIPRDNP